MTPATRRGRFALVVAWLVVPVVGITVGVASAQSTPTPLPPPTTTAPVLIAEDAYHLLWLLAERRSLEARFRELKAQTDLIQMEIPTLQQQDLARRQELEGVIAAAAGKAGLNPAEWRPNPTARTWERVTPTPAGASK